jgi:hypothetical protein
MKQLYVLCIAVLACTVSFAQTTISLASTDGSWRNASDWDQDRLPANGDIVTIPANKTLTVDRSVTGNDIHLKVYGKLTLTGQTTQITLTGNSDIVVYEGGMIEGSGANQKLRIGDNVVYLGKNPPVLGPAMATAAAPSFAPVIALSVKFLGFSLARRDNNVLVQWSTAEEVNSHSFEVERSLDGATWTKIATLRAKGTSASIANYSYTDRSVTAAIAYYRVRQVDNDGKYLYTAIKTITFGTGTPEVTIASINSRVVLQFSSQVKGAVEVRLVSLSGQVVGRHIIHQPVGQVILNNAPVKGHYIVAVSNAGDINLAKQVIL